MKPYIPIWKRPPNKFLYYTTELFEDSRRNSAILTLAHFIDKHNIQQSVIAYVKWKLDEK